MWQRGARGMSERITLSLREPVQAKQAVNAAWLHIKGWLGAGGERLVLMGMQSRDFTIKLARAFIDWLYALGAEHDVAFKAWEGEQ